MIRKIMTALILVSILSCTIKYVKIGSYQTTQDINSTNHNIKDIISNTKDDDIVADVKETTKNLLEGMGILYGFNKVLKLPQINKKQDTSSTTRSTLTDIKNNNPSQKEGIEKIKQAMKNMMTPEQFEKWCIKEGFTYVNGDCI